MKENSGAIYACKRMLGSAQAYRLALWYSGVMDRCQRDFLQKIRRIRRLPVLCLTKAMRTTPTAVLESLHNQMVVPLQ